MVMVESTTNWPQLCSVQSTAGETLPAYSGTSEIRTPRDLAKVFLFRRCP